TARRAPGPQRDVPARRSSDLGEPISPEAFVAAWYDVKPYVEMIDSQLAEEGQSRLSFFEVLTVMALAAFADAPVDVAILEVGMGDRKSTRLNSSHVKTSYAVS